MISKIKKFCNAAFIPRIMRYEVITSPRKLGKRTFDGFWKMAKSTDSKDREAECEKCKKLIDMVFGPEKQDIALKQVPMNIDDIQNDKIKKVIAPTIALNEKPIESKSVVPIKNAKKELESVDASIKIKTLNPTTLHLNNTLQSTTAKSTEEQLAQKLETIDEPGLVEAATPKPDGFNTYPKMLGAQENVLQRNNFLYTNIKLDEVTIDEIAKKCLGTPPDKIDERILEEMKSCGLLGRRRKKSTLKRSGYSAVKSNEKEVVLETKSEQSTLYYTNQHVPTKQHSEKIHTGYFKKEPLHLIGDGRLERNTDDKKNKLLEQNTEKAVLKDVKTIQQQEKTTSVLSDNSTVLDSYMKNPIINDQICAKTKESNEYLTESTTTEEEKPKELLKDDDEEVEVEKLRITAAENRHLGSPGETEVDPDFDYKNTRPEVLPCNIFGIAQTSFKDNFNNSDKQGSIACSDTKNSADWDFRPNIANNPVSVTNTAISSTYPPSTPSQPETSQNDTSISSNQNPGEYFDLSHCNMGEAEDDYVIGLSEIRSLAAYHQYTIITGTDEVEKSKNVLFSKEVAPEVPTLKLESAPQIENQNSPKTINKDISAAMGPLPQLKDMEDELSLTEMLRRVRERNRLQYCRECAIEAEPLEANKNPSDKGTPKTLGPKPCQPKPKPACPPPPPPCPSPCPPTKPKDPCAKFTKSIIADKIKETFTFVLQVAFKPDLVLTPTFTNKIKAVEPFVGVLHNKDIRRIELFESFFLSNCPASTKTRFGREDVILARDYEPWTPIPSWPMSKKKEKKPFICPKEGCKVDYPPHINTPCKKDKPCISNLPKRTFSLIEFVYEPLFLYDH